MKTIDVVDGPQNVSRILLGCMRMPDLSIAEAANILNVACEQGINFFDNAVCYGLGEAERRFGDALALTDINREDIVVQTKCGIHSERGEFDWSKENILACVDDSLSRMKLQYLDVLLLHRPDLLFDPCEVAETFEILEKSGKVRYFGMSNVTPGQLELLRKYVKQPLVFNQLQLSLDQTQLLDPGLYLNNLATERSIDRDNGVLDYCRLHDIVVQAWSPLQFGTFEGCFIDHPDYPELNAALGELAEKHGVSKSAIAIAWILRHPAKMQAVVGTMNPERLKSVCAASDVELTRHEWYQLYLASGKFLP